MYPLGGGRRACIPSGGNSSGLFFLAVTVVTKPNAYCCVGTGTSSQIWGNIHPKVISIPELALRKKFLLNPGHLTLGYKIKVKKYKGYNGWYVPQLGRLPLTAEMQWRLPPKAETQWRLPPKAEMQWVTAP